VLYISGVRAVQTLDRWSEFRALQVLSVDCYEEYPRWDPDAQFGWCLVFVEVTCLVKEEPLRAMTLAIQRRRKFRIRILSTPMGVFDQIREIELRARV